MSWIRYQTVLLLLACIVIVLCRTEKLCNGDMWSEPQTVFNGESFRVFCRCNGSQVNLQNVTLQHSDLKKNWNITNHDAHTVVHQEYATCGRKYFRIYCMHGDEILGELFVRVMPFLNLKVFQCTEAAYGKEASCYFEEFEFAASIPEKTYSLSIDGLPSIPCSKGDHHSNWIHCNGFYVPRNSNYAPNHQIQLSMEYGGVTQTQVFPMTKRQAPVWPLTQPEFIQGPSGLCLNWTHTENVTPSSPKQNWKVEILPKNPKINVMPYEILLIPAITPMICLPKLPYANQLYSFRFKRRYNTTGAPWSSFFESKEITSDATVPARPPNLLPNGFYHDPEKRELYVFWRQLDELELNGHNFTYAAVTDSGKKPSSVDNNCVIFSNWDPTLPATIFVWSQNSVGTSTTSTWLEVPPLTNSGSRQPQDLRYHEDNYTLTWQPPEEQQDLTGYAISWCLGSTSRFQICNNQESVHFERVPLSQFQFEFSQSMLLFNVAVTASYKGKPSGGMKWIRPSFHKDEEMTSGLGLSQDIAVMVAVVGLLLLGFVFLRKLRKMAKIEVSLPEIMFKSVDIQISSPDPCVCIAVPGNYPPKGMLTIDILTRECPVEEDQDYSSQPSTPASNLASSLKKDLAIEIEKEIKKGSLDTPGNEYLPLKNIYIIDRQTY